MKYLEYEASSESKDTSHVGRKGNFYAYYGNTAVDLDPLPVSCALLTVVEPALFEWDVFEMLAPIQSPAKCEVRSDHKTKWMGSALMFLTRHAHEGDEFLDSIVTCFFN